MEDEDINGISEIGDIIEIIKTNNLKNPNEYMMLAYQGLYFITINYENKYGKVPRFTFSFNQDEAYFHGLTVKGAFEYDTGKIITILNN